MPKVENVPVNVLVLTVESTIEKFPVVLETVKVPVHAVGPVLAGVLVDVTVPVLAYWQPMRFPAASGVVKVNVAVKLYNWSV